jgi:neutral ceramidase
VLRIGVSEVDITPAPGLPRAGMLHPEKGTGTGWPLRGCIFVFDDGAHRAALVTLDLLWLTTPSVAEFRQAITAGLPIAPEDVMLACSHSHWAPHTSAIMDEDTNFEYLDFVRGRIAEGMARAWAARRPARVKAGSVDAPGWSFNRREIYQTPLGEQVGTQGPQWIPEFVGLEGPADHQLQALLCEGADGACLGGLVNFSCHPTVGMDEPLYSADYPGPMAARLARVYGAPFGFVNGACGNIWQQDTAKNQPGHEYGSAHTLRMGEALAQKAQEALQSGSYIRGERVGMARQVLRIPQRRALPQQVELAKGYLERRPENLDYRAYHVSISGHEHTFYRDWSKMQDPEERAAIHAQEEWFARALIGMWEWQRRVGTRELIEDVEVQVMTVGEVAFAGFPAEYFTEFGLRVKAASPFPHTFISEVTNGWHGYVPIQEAFQHGGYETRLGDASRLVPEAGDRMCDAAIELLKQLAI